MPDGTFTQEDPIGLAGGLNLYGYANGDPVNFSDPFGLCPDENEANTVCVSLFIQAETLAFGALKGDGRGFQSTSDPGQSRLYIVVDVANQTVLRKGANPSCWSNESCSDSPSPLNALGASFADDGSFTVSISGHDSKTTVPGVSAFLQFTPNSEGSYGVDGFATLYPFH